MFTLISEAQELTSGVYADYLQDDETKDLFVVLNPHNRTFVVYVGNMAGVYLDDFSDKALEENCYKDFNSYGDFCKWLSYNLTS